jgi:hypothetical protein
MVNVHLHLGVILKYQIVDGRMIQLVISLGYEHKNQHLQLVLDHQQVNL